jgi:ribose transport system permease protein
VTVFFKIPSFVVTLGMLGVLQGYSEAITNSSTWTVTDKAFLNLFGKDTSAPSRSWSSWSVGTALVGALVLSATRHRPTRAGHRRQPERREVLGHQDRGVKIVVLMFSGMGGALGGLIYVGQFTAATFTLRIVGPAVTSSAAVIVGATALAGGQAA